MSIHQKELATLNVYAPKKKTFKHTKQKVTEQKEIDNSTILVGDFDTLCSVIDRNTRNKISKDRENLNNTNNQQNLTFIERSNNSRIYIFFFPEPLTTLILLRMQSTVNYD